MRMKVDEMILSQAPRGITEAFPRHPGVQVALEADLGSGQQMHEERGVSMGVPMKLYDPACMTCRTSTLLLPIPVSSKEAWNLLASPASAPGIWLQVLAVEIRLATPPPLLPLSLYALRSAPRWIHPFHRAPLRLNLLPFLLSPIPLLLHLH